MLRLFAQLLGEGALAVLCLLAGASGLVGGSERDTCGVVGDLESVGVGVDFEGRRIHILFNVIAPARPKQDL